jgi:hypothetical protein
MNVSFGQVEYAQVSGLFSMEAIFAVFPPAAKLKNIIEHGWGVPV